MLPAVDPAVCCLPPCLLLPLACCYIFSCSCLEALEQRSSSRNHLGQAAVRADMCRNAAQGETGRGREKERDRERRRAHINSLSLPLLLAFIFVRVPTKKQKQQTNKNLNGGVGSVLWQSPGWQAAAAAEEEERQRRRGRRE